MRQRSLDEMITYFNQEIDKMDIDRRYKISLLGMVTAIGCKAQQTIMERKKGKWIDDNCSVCGAYVYHGDVKLLPELRGEDGERHMKCKDCPHLAKTESVEIDGHWDLYCKKHDIKHCPVAKENLKYVGCVEGERRRRCD